MQASEDSGQAGALGYDTAGMKTPSRETMVWSIHPSWRALLPSIALGVGVSAVLLLNAIPVVQAVVDMTYTVIPWTQAGVDRVFDVSRAAFLAPALVPLFKLLMVLLTTYELTDQRVILHHGLFPRRHDEIALHRIRDRVVKRSLIGMVLGYGTIRLITRDPSFPVVKMKDVSQPYDRSERIRSLALLWKKRMGYREFDSGALS